MKTQDLISKGWKKKTIRIAPAYSNLLSFFEYKAKLEGVHRHIYIDHILSQALVSLSNYHFQIKDYPSMRLVKGFMFSKELEESFSNALEMIEYPLYVSQFLELLLYVYASEQMPDDLISIIQGEELNIVINKKC